MVSEHSVTVSPKPDPTLASELPKMTTETELQRSLKSLELAVKMFLQMACERFGLDPIPDDFGNQVDAIPEPQTDPQELQEQRIEVIGNKGPKDLEKWVDPVVGLKSSNHVFGGSTSPPTRNGKVSDGPDVEKISDEVFELSSHSKVSDISHATRSRYLKKLTVRGFHKVRKKERDISVSSGFEVFAHSAKKVIGMKGRLGCSKEATLLKLVQAFRSYGVFGDSAGSIDSNDFVTPLTEQSMCSKKVQVKRWFHRARFKQGSKCDDESVVSPMCSRKALDDNKLSVGVGTDEELDCVAGRDYHVWEPGGSFPVKVGSNELERVGDIQCLKRSGADAETHLGIKICKSDLGEQLRMVNDHDLEVQRIAKVHGSDILSLLICSGDQLERLKTAYGITSIRWLQNCFFTCPISENYKQHGYLCIWKPHCYLTRVVTSSYSGIDSDIRVAQLRANEIDIKKEQVSFSENSGVLVAAVIASGELRSRQNEVGRNKYQRDTTKMTLDVENGHRDTLLEFLKGTETNMRLIVVLYNSSETSGNYEQNVAALSSLMNEMASFVVDRDFHKREPMSDSSIKVERYMSQDQGLQLFFNLGDSVVDVITQRVFNSKVFTGEMVAKACWVQAVMMETYWKVFKLDDERISGHNSGDITIIGYPLALGTLKMAQENACVRKLPRVETLGFNILRCCPRRSELEQRIATLEYDRDRKSVSSRMKLLLDMGPAVIWGVDLKEFKSVNDIAGSESDELMYHKSGATQALDKKKAPKISPSSSTLGGNETGLDITEWSVLGIELSKGTGQCDNILRAGDGFGGPEVCSIVDDLESIAYLTAFFFTYERFHSPRPPKSIFSIVSLKCSILISWRLLDASKQSGVKRKTESGHLSTKHEDITTQYVEIALSYRNTSEFKISFQAYVFMISVFNVFNLEDKVVSAGEY